MRHLRHVACSLLVHLHTLFASHTCWAPRTTPPQEGPPTAALLAPPALTAQLREPLGLEQEADAAAAAARQLLVRAPCRGEGGFSACMHARVRHGWRPTPIAAIFA